ncbi:hypothetical protein ACFRCI_35845 [Streptomyces sp. NPDC056638]|uniref:hypothetical protein n=1 Tax=Streptomyces sp. NPDC056638 TaxID=3345887 RepID=UPI00368C6F83
MTSREAGIIVKEHALRTRASRRTESTTMSLRTALLVLAVVPGVALTALWAVTSGPTLLDFQRRAAHGQLVQKAGRPSEANCPPSAHSSTTTAAISRRPCTATTRT